MATLDVGVERVGALLRTRTKTPSGVELGTFTPAATPQDQRTRPNAEQVAELIELAKDSVLGSRELDLPDKCQNASASAVALKAALLVELTFFPEQVATGHSPYAEYAKLYTDSQVRLDSCLSGQGDVPQDPDGPAYIGMPVYYGDVIPFVGDARW